MQFSSTEIRRQGLTDFLTSYEQCCSLQNSVPLKVVSTSFCSNCLCLDASKIRVSDWPPLLRALSTAKKIQKLRFTSTWRSGRPTPIVHQDNSTIQKQIVQSLKHLLSKKNDLREFAIEQIQLYVPTLTELGAALEQKYCNIINLSLNRCRIGDLGFSKIYRYLKNREVLNRLDLSGCDLSPVAMTMVIETLKSQYMRGQGQFWVDNLRKLEHEIDQSKSSGIKVLKLNDNPRIADAVIPLLTAIIYDDIRYIERIELRRCAIQPSPKFDSLLEDMLDKIPRSLSVVDLRENALLENETTRDLVQLLMSKLLTTHPKSEYDVLKRSPRPLLNEKKVTTITEKSLRKIKSKASRRVSINELSSAINQLPTVVAAGQTGFVPWRTAEKSIEKKIKSTCKRYGVGLGSTETPDSSSDIDSHVGAEYCDLPGTSDQYTDQPPAEPVQIETDRFNETTDLVDCLNRERAERELEVQSRRDCEAKYQQLSSRLSTLEHILQSKDDQIQSLLDEKEGHVLVEEHLLRTIEQSFSKFQGFLGMLNELGLSQLTEMAEFQELNELAHFPTQNE